MQMLKHYWRQSVLGVAMTPGVLRIVRGSVFVERQKDYVMAARAMGSPAWQIMFRQILPNVLAPIIIIGTTLLAAAGSVRGDGLSATNENVRAAFRRRRR